MMNAGIPNVCVSRISTAQLINMVCHLCDSPLSNVDSIQSFCYSGSGHILAYLSTVIVNVPKFF